MNRLISNKIGLAMTAASLLACFFISAICASDDAEILKAIAHGQESYVESVKKMSVKKATFISLDGNDMIQATDEFLQDDKNFLVTYNVIYNKYIVESSRPGPTSLVGISRIRGPYRQQLDISRAKPTAPWVIPRDISSPITDENRSLHYENDKIIGFIHFDNYRCAPALYYQTVSELVGFPGFRLNSITENRDGPERLVTIDFTVDPPLNQKTPKTFIRSGRMKLRPDACWTLKSGIFQLDGTCQAGKVIECVVTNTYHDEPEKKNLPKEVKCVSTVITKDNKKAEEIRRSTYQFASYAELPDERFSLTQFGMSEREPVINTPKENPVDSNPNVNADKRSYLAAYSTIPPYLWLTAIGIVLLILGIALRIWIVRTSNDLVAKPSSSK